VARVSRGVRSNHSEHQSLAPFVVNLSFS
jgi:hypothetical protein